MRTAEGDKLLLRLTRVVGNKQDGNGNKETGTEHRHIKKRNIKIRVHKQRRWVIMTVVGMPTSDLTARH